MLTNRSKFPLKIVLLIPSALFLVYSLTRSRHQTQSWFKYEHNPVFGGSSIGTVFDVSVLARNKGYDMYFSWRPKRSIAITHSTNGIQWSEPIIVLPGLNNSEWQFDVNRPIVLYRNKIWHMWYSGQNARRKQSSIGYATSNDGRQFWRHPDPILTPNQEWEKQSLMCPHVVWDTQEQYYRMWYSGGDFNEPNAIGYAVSPNGIDWEKHIHNPVLQPDNTNMYERDRTTACQVLWHKHQWLMFYIGFKDINSACICLARSTDGIHWERYPNNPIIKPTPGTWDGDATYKPYALYTGRDWLLWYNGRNKTQERIGLAIHRGDINW